MRVVRKLVFASLLLVVGHGFLGAVELRGVIVEADSGRPVEGRLYIEGKDGALFHATSPEGTAIPYDVRRGGSVEVQPVTETPT